MREIILMQSFDLRNVKIYRSKKVLLGLNLFPLFIIAATPSAFAKNSDASLEKSFGAIEIGTHFSKINQELEAHNEHAKIPDFGGCKRLGVLSVRPQDECEFRSRNGIIYYFDVRGLVYKIKLVPNSKNKWPHKFPFGIKPSDTKQKVQAKFAKHGLKSDTNNNDKADTFPNQVACYHQLNKYSKTVCFLFNESGKIAQIRIDSWDFEAKANNLKEIGVLN